MHPKIVKIVQHPYLNLAVGLSLAVSGYMELVDEERAITAAHGAMLLGLFHIFKFILELMESGDLLLEGAKEENILPRISRKLSENFYVHMIIATALIFVSLIETAQQIEVEFAQGNQVWHFGLIGAGMMYITKASANFADALAFASEAGEERQQHWLIKLTQSLHFPKIELFLGIFVIIFSIWEELINETSITNIGAHHGMLVFAIVSITKIFASFAVTIDVVNNTERQRRSR